MNSIRRPDEWLTASDSERATMMERTVRSVFGLSTTETHTYTPHDPDHFARVEDLIWKLIPPKRWRRLTAQERMFLTWAAWTHDIGMHRQLYKPQTSDSNVRHEHVDRSAQWVMEKHLDLGMSVMEAQVLAQIIRCHSRKYDLSDCPTRRQCHGSYVRSRLIAAYLRLADALDVTHQRVGSHQYDRFPYLVESIGEASEDTVFHWVKSFVVAGIAVLHEKQEIEIEFQFPRQETDAPDRYELLVRYVMDELRSELQTVEETLSTHGLSSFHLVTRAKDVRLDDFLNEEWPQQIPRVLNFLRMEYSPNSTEIALAALDAIDEVALAFTKMNSTDTQLKHQFEMALYQLQTKLRASSTKRKCHNALHRILAFIGAKAAKEDKRAVKELALELQAFVQNFRRLIEPDKDVARKRSVYFWTLLDELCQDKPKRRDFVLFGCSDSVISALSDKPEGISLGLWIAEGRPKSEHGPYNTRKYLDGERYAQMIHERMQVKGERFLNDVHLNIIPDASVATLLDRAKSGTFQADQSEKILPRIDGVLFGTNGIYQSPQLCVAHTAGHLGIAMVAKEFRIPVVVIATALKIQPEFEAGWDTSLRNTKGEWLTTDTEVLSRLRKKYRADLRWNLREDHVPVNYLSAIITELGCLRTTTAEEIANANQILTVWSDTIDRVLNGDCSFIDSMQECVAE